MGLFFFIFVAMSSVTMGNSESELIESQAKTFVDRYNEEISLINCKASTARWIFNTNMTTENEKELNFWDLHLSNRSAVLREKARATFNISSLQDLNIRRQLKLLLISSTARDEKITERLSEVHSLMRNIYSKAHVKYNAAYIKTFDGNTTILKVNQVAHIFATSTDPKELKYCWDEWRASIGPQIRPLFTEMVQLLNQGAMDNGYESEAGYRQNVYEVDNLHGDVLKFWSGLKPLYEELHAYVRYRLSDVFPDLVHPRKGIPAHLLGNLWTTDWQELVNRVKPYPGE